MWRLVWMELFLFFLFAGSLCHAQVQADMVPVILFRVEEGFGHFDRGTWKIGEKPNEAAIRALVKEKGGLRLFAVDGIGVLFLPDDTEIGGKAGCYGIQDLDRILMERAEEAKWRKARERETFFGEKAG